ncbi:hypothetical protein CGCA056_v002775 [Colletotrichum aenigma]|uniref:uncharacterized protein n=1 Tax=Colletotrichum aenigma TaxID=1215731 RepID=UPI0018729E03|nr:uncharacterized protein CGCA056_v002775 [Colletotrichum aenigma]KAF5525166.1 hypothetical protein CGCA056_v002775 [Colletotrichum aenigma]
MASSTQVYTTVTTTHWYVNGQKGSKVYELAPQTTPFSATDSVCSIVPKGIRCEERANEVVPRNVCWGLQFVEETRTWFPTQCFPKSYTDIYKPFKDFSDLVTLAYPGTACISDWTSACLTTLDLTNSQRYIQKWCCPPGWDCYTQPEGDSVTRDCYSVVSTPTDIWFYPIVTTGKSDRTITTSWTKVPLTDLPNQGPIEVHHPVFPLEVRVPIQDDKTEASGLSTGAIAGTAVGVFVVALALVGGGLFVCLRKRKQKREARISQIAAGERDIHQHGYDNKQELSGDHAFETIELSKTSPPPVELSSRTRPAEIEGTVRPVELA